MHFEILVEDQSGKIALQFLLEKIPNATLKTFPRAGHMVMLEKPEEINEAIREFILSLPES